MKKICLLLVLITLLMSASALAESKGGDIVIPQLSDLYQFKIPQNEALAFTSQMKIGWNLGNTFDATNDGYVRDEMDIESNWVGVKTTEGMIEAIQQAGFNTIRIPVSWHNHVNKETFEISEPWLSRVEEVAHWALERGMYVIVNIHHDVYPEFYYPSEEHYATAERYITTVWKQLASRFADYDNHLIFESMNEPRLKGTDIEWWFDASNPAGLEAAECINRLNQAFVDVIRASGGNNADRFLMVPGYCAAPGFACASYFRLPEDPAQNRLIVSAHAYTPYSFALDLKGTDSFSASDAGAKREISNFMNDLYLKFIKNGIPVVIGEFGAMEKNGNLQDRVDFAALYVANASARGIPCCWWDNHIFRGNGERFGLLDRKNLTFPHPELVEALMTYAGYDSIPVRPE